MLSEVMGSSIVVTLRENVDPIKKYVVFDLGIPLTKGNYTPMQTMVHAYAKVNDCVVAAIRKESPRRFVLEVLLKNRISQEMRNDPFLSDKAEPPKEG